MLTEGTLAGGPVRGNPSGPSLRSAAGVPPGSARLVGHPSTSTPPGARTGREPAVANGALDEARDLYADRKYDEAASAALVSIAISLDRLERDAEPFLNMLATAVRHSTG